MKCLHLVMFVAVPALLGFAPAVQCEQTTVTPVTDTAGDVPLLMYFKSDNCTSCGPFDLLFEQQSTRDRIEQHYNAVCLNINETEGQFCAEIYDVTATPALIIADRQGLVIFRSGSTLTEEEIAMILEALPAEPLPSVIAELPEAKEEVTGVDTDNSGNATTVILRTTGLTIHDREPEVRLTATTDLSTLNTNVLLIQKPRNIDLQRTYADSGDGESVPSIENKVIAKTIAVPESETSAPKRVQNKWHYAVQLGYFSTRPNAMKLVNNGIAQGLPDMRTEDTLRANQEYYRVLSGTYRTLEEAQAQLYNAVSLGFNAVIYRW